MLVSNHAVSLVTFTLLYGHCIWYFFSLQLVKLDSLALYWNSNDDIGKLPSQEEWQVNPLRTDLSLHHLIERFFYYSPIMVTILTSLSVITNIRKNST